MRLRVKICCMASAEEAAMAATAGADMIGLVGPMPAGGGVIALSRARQIAETAPAWVSPVLLTSGETADAIAREVQICPVRCVQIVRHLDPQVHRDLARRLPSVRRIQAIHVEGREALDHLPSYSGVVDAFLLDSGRPGSDELAGTGRTHDWSISAEFVRRSPVPVFLAGGLDAGNVGAAIRAVRPFGLDLCSGIRVENKLNTAKLWAFMVAAGVGG